MKIEASNRLLAAHKLLAETMREYVQRLGSEGIQKIDSGGYAHVFQHPTMPDVVVKLLHAHDAAYEKYVEFCERHKNNPYVPKIHGVESAENVFDQDHGMKNLFLVFMEKLKPLSNAEYEAFGTHCAELANAVIEDEVFEGARESINELNGDLMWNSLATQTKDPALAELARYIDNAKYHELDITNDNVMLRGRQVVIVDPFVS